MTATATHESDPDATLRFVEELLKPPGTVIEFRVIRGRIRNGYIVPSDYQTILAGWYDSAHALMVDAGRLRGVSGYVVTNPCDPDLLARSCNRLTTVKNATKDEDVMALRWAFLDIDPARKADISSTDAELALAMAKRDLILKDNPNLAKWSMSGSSGNGAWILTKTCNGPNDELHRQKVADFLSVMSNRYSDDKVKIDVTTKNPARVSALPGTMKCKGMLHGQPPPSARHVRLEGESSMSGFDLDGFLAEHAHLLPKETPRATTLATRSATMPPTSGQRDEFANLSDLNEKFHRATRYLANFAPAVAGQNGSSQTFDAACTLVLDFDLAVHEAKPILAAWNHRCEPPWSDAELDHKLRDADAKGGPRGRLLNANKEGYQRTEIFLAPECDWEFPGQTSVSATTSVPAVSGQPKPPADDPDELPCLPGMEGDRRRLASVYLQRKHNHPDGVTLRFWNGEFHHWTEGAYVPLKEKNIKGKLAVVIADDFEKIRENQCIKEAMKGDRAKPVTSMPVTTGLTADVCQSMAGMTMVDAGRQPCWVDCEGWPAHEILPMRNAIVHLPSFMKGEAVYTRKPTPKLFCPYVLKYDWDPHAGRPEKFLDFVDATFPKDRESVEALQEWFGLQLVPVTKYQKMMAFIGPPRAGKGVIASIMRAMVGEANSCGPTLTSLTEPFGLQNLIGKLSAIIDDARLSGRSDQAAITERLLSISGEGTLDVNQKNRDYWSGVLTTRITLISNELPRLNDNSNALASRFLILKFTKSHYGHEDNTLKGQFLDELSGILLWAIEGLRRLTDRGHFVQPKSARDIHDEMEEMSSPIGCFVQDCCVVSEHEVVEKMSLYQAWKQWCEINGRKEVGEMNVFARNLRSVVPSLKAIQPRDGLKRVHSYRGIGLLPPEALLGGGGEGAGDVDWTYGN